MSFQVIPAIDLRGGRCVRLHQGDYDQETAYGDDPVAVAQRWESLGAPLLHVVDLDGAKVGRPQNDAIVRAICAAVRVPVEVSGGIRTMSAIEAALAGGAARVQLGSVAVREPELVREAARRFGNRLSVAIDGKTGEVRTDGWLRGSGISVLQLARGMVEAGVARLMVTDIGRDGAMAGPNVALYEELVRELPVPIVASGGVTALDHLRQLASAGCEGVVIGKALYEGVLDLGEALAVARMEAV